jgi:hypothetical protein
VCIGERFTRLQHVINGKSYRLRSVLRDDIEQVTTVQELHDDEGSSIIKTSNIIDARNMLTFNTSGRQRFMRESTGHLGIRQHLWPQELERDLLRELKVIGSHNEANAADTQQFGYLEFTSDNLPN